MKIAESARLEIAWTPDPDAPPVLHLKLENWNCTIDLPVSELLELASQLPIKELLAAVIARIPGRGS